MFDQVTQVSRKKDSTGSFNKYLLNTTLCQVLFFIRVMYVRLNSCIGGDAYILVGEDRLYEYISQINAGCSK